MESTSLLDTLTASIESIKKGQKLSGMQLAHILRDITVCELVPGGPYALPGSEKANYELSKAVAEFLELFGIQLPQLDEFLRAYTTADSSKDIVTAVQALIQKRVGNLAVGLQTLAMDVTRRTLAKNPEKQMALMPYYVREALGSRGSQFTDEQVIQFGYASSLFWIAGTIYDDFWDEDEMADPKLLPIANLFAREYICFFSVADQDVEFQEFFRTGMDQLDSANVWETSECRMEQSYKTIRIPEQLPDFGNLENKFYPVFGHVFAPVLMLVRLDYVVDSREITAFIEYFKHYIIAMQLNDDLHDWKEDLARGHISTVVCELLAKWKDAHPGRSKLYLEYDLPKLEELFWFEVLLPFCHTILEHCRKSRAALHATNIFENTLPLELLITRTEDSAQKAIDTYVVTKDLLSVLQ